MYNQKPDYLKECIESAIGQTYPNVEIIVSDNHSTNGASRVLDSFSSGRLRVIKPTQHLGIIDHFNFAASAATGEYISFLSSDDFIYPECIERVVKPLIENKGLSFSYCENALLDDSENNKAIVRKLQLPTGVYKKKEFAARTYLGQEYWIIGGIIRNELFRKVPFAKDIVAGDWILGLQLLKYGDVAYINEELSVIRLHERKGEDKKAYAERYLLHNKQRVMRHNYIIEDQELLDAIDMPKSEAIAYRDKEILGSVIVLVREYHKGLVSDELVTKSFEFYKQNRSGFAFNFLTRFYTSKLALAYTYVLGFFSWRVKNFFKKKMS
jgi:glycosyltransferase involved in cell wall biosynthesis